MDEVGLEVTGDAYAAFEDAYGTRSLMTGGLRQNIKGI